MRFLADECCEAIVEELRQLLPMLRDRISHIPLPAPVPSDVPLLVHCTYSRDEIMAGFGDVRKGKLYQPREGVVFHEPSRRNLLFVTLRKTEKDYSPSTMYEDYALSPKEFHWQSQSTTQSESTKGQRHWNHRDLGVTPLLFIREAKLDDRRMTMPYLFVGEATYVRHEGARPMSITWRLEAPIPSDYLRVARMASQERAGIPGLRRLYLRKIDCHLYYTPGKEALRDLVNRIVESVTPERIILFGSAARGDMGPHSDLDVLVVKSGDYRRIEVLHAIRRALRGFPFAVDLVVARPAELKRHSESQALVYHPALKEGRELYAA